MSDKLTPLALARSVYDELVDIVANDESGSVFNAIFKRDKFTAIGAPISTLEILVVERIKTAVTQASDP